MALYVPLKQFLLPAVLFWSPQQQYRMEMLISYLDMQRNHSITEAPRKKRKTRKASIYVEMNHSDALVCAGIRYDGPLKYLQIFRAG